MDVAHFSETVGGNNSASLSELETYLSEMGYHFTSNYPDKEYMIRGYSSLSHYKKGTLTWIKKQEKVAGIDFDEITLVIAQNGVNLPTDRVIYCDNSKAAFFGIIDDVFDKEELKAAIGNNTYISDGVSIGKNVSIGANCVLDGEITIGDRVRIMDGVVIINRVLIGDDTVIQPLSVIGIDGFGYYEDEDGNKRMVRHHGGVEIGSNVFIGSHTNIARGTLDDTVIKDGVKIAPSTHIGHNNIVGENTTIICSNLYGSCNIGDNAYLTACTVKNQSKVGNHALVGMGAVVTKNVEDDNVVVGIPARFLRKRSGHDV